MDRSRVADLLEATERPMMLLALVAVALYLADLAGFFAVPEVWSAYFAVALLIDVIFVVDLTVKLAVLRGAYVRSPWFVVDLVCAMPVLSTLSLAPSALQGLRFVRSFRMLRALRMLRVVRSLRILKVVSTRIEDTPEARAYRRALTGAVVLYAVVFVGLVAMARHDRPQGRVIAVDGLADRGMDRLQPVGGRVGEVDLLQLVDHALERLLTEGHSRRPDDAGQRVGHGSPFDRLLAHHRELQGCRSRGRHPRGILGQVL